MAEKAYGMTTGKRLGDGVVSVVLNAIMITFSASCIFPLVWMFYSSLKIKREFNANIMGLPPNPTLNNYRDIITNQDYHIADSLINSLRTTVLSVFLILLFGFIVGYILARVKFAFNRVIWLMMLMGMLIPVHSLLVPIYIVFNTTKMNNQWYTLLFPYIAFGMPIAVFLIHSYVKTIPTALEEAASIDGSTFTNTLFRIIMPICKPVLVTIAIIQT
ncbi:MAG: carbohydrate ABC transporter permease, partial [Clostridia bacterium]|nr:carbohydrate ABC transporter permease [Clostridia bacterium]